MELFDKEGFPLICRECGRSCHRCPNIINGQRAIRLREHAAMKKLQRSMPILHADCASF